MRVDARRAGQFVIPALAALLATAVACWASRPYAVGVFHDDGVYVILGKSIATGQGYRFLHLPGAPAATHYPPGYPLLLALLWRLVPSFPANVPLFLFANALLLGATAFGVERFAERVAGWPRPAATLAALVATLSVPLLMLSGLVLSECLFTAALFPILTAAERSVRAGAGEGKETPDAARDGWRMGVLGLALGGLALVRAHALALAVAVLLVLAWRRRWRAVLACAAGLAVVAGPWQLWLAAHQGGLPELLRGSYGSYTAWLVDGWRGHLLSVVPRTMAINAREVGATLADRFSLSDAAHPRLVTEIVATLAIAAGAWRLRRRAPVFVLFVGIYVLVLLAWPYTPWRFVFALWPAVVLCLGAALESVWCSIAEGGLPGQRGVGALGLAAWLSLAAGALRQEGRAYAGRTWARPAAAAAAQIAPLVQWVKNETRPADLLAVDGEQLVYLFTNRRAVPLVPFTAAEYVRPRTTDDDVADLKLLLDEYHVRYVATVSPALSAAADRIVALDSARTGAGESALVPMAGLASGRAYRVERP